MSESQSDELEDDEIFEIAKTIKVSLLAIQTISALSLFRSQILEQIGNSPEPKHTSGLS